MSRTLKGTRARGLPPKVLLSQRQDATGSFPTVWRTSSDNRTGKYPVFFNDDKVIPFNQFEAADYDSSFPLGNAVYVEKVENIGAVETGGTASVTYPTAFVGVPIVVISELSSANGDSSQNVNVFLSASNPSNFTVKFSSQFTGSFVYRAAYDPSPGTLRVVERKPRYPNIFTRFTVKQTALTASNTTDITFNDFGDDTAENFVTFFDDSGNGQADIWPNITTQTRTLVALTASSIATATVEFQRFHDLHNRGIIYPLGMNQTAILAGLSQENQIEMYGSVSFISGAVVNQPTKWIVASGSMKKNVADTFITFTPGQDIQAFRDNSNPAVVGKISSSVNGINPFYATGSAVRVTGQGFQQPLWSKSKIEIDLTPATTHTVIMVPTGSNVNYPMMYWNKERKLYEGIGSGTGVSGAYSSANNLNGIRALLDEQTLGFGTSLARGENIPQESLGVLARQISSFGFPYHQKFQPTGSQQISMDEYISEPFLLEKIVFEVSSALRVYPDSFISSPIWTFFLLNSRTNISGSVVGIQTITPYQLNSNTPFLTSSISNGYQLDLVDYFQIAFTGSVLSNPGYYFKSTDRELILRNPLYTAVSPTNIYYSNQMTISSSVKTSIAYNGVYSIFAATRFFRQDLSISGRSSISSLNGRDWVTSFGKPEILNTFAFTYGPPTVVNKSYTKTNPYLLLPTDKLTIGCQLPWSLYASEYNSVSSSITFSPQGINKITLYGSSLRVNPETNQLEEHHDTLNQLLSSNSIHEIIGD